MKIRFFSLVFCIAALLFVSSCDDMKDVPSPVNLPEIQGETGKLYLLSEGLFNMNNSTLSLIDFDKRNFTQDVFGFVNNRGLGDTANDLQLFDNKLWIVVNVSSQVEVIDLNTGISIHRFSIFNENNQGRQPRFIAFAGEKAYVCSFDGTVTRIDIPTLAIDGLASCGRNPDGIAVANNKLYVSNSGGLDNPNYDSTVSVIDIPTFREIKKIDVGLNPYKLAADSEGDMYVISRGNNSDIKSKFCKLNSESDELVQTFSDIPAVNFCLRNDTAYLYNFDFVTNEYSVKTFDCKSEQIISDSFITDGTVLERPFCIAVNPRNGNVYFTDAHGYTVKGDFLCFNRQGKLQYKLESVGLNPNSIISVP